MFFWQKNGIDDTRRNMFYIYLFMAISMQCFIIKEKELIYYLPEGVQYAPNDPVQVNFSEKTSKEMAFTYELDPKFTLEPLASYDITAMVLDRNTHFKKEWDSDSYLWMDLGFGWEKLSDQFYALHKNIKFDNRFYYLSFRIKRGYPLTYKDIDYILSNTHILAKDKATQKKLKQAKTGRVVRLKGYLVTIINDGRVSRKSSLVRTDGGNGACEAMYVTDVDIVEKGTPFKWFRGEKK